VSHTTEFYLFDTSIVISWTYGILITRWLSYSRNNCIKIVTGTSEFHVFDNPIVMGYIAAYLLHWYCESHIGISFVRQPHRDELYPSIFIILMLWVAHRNFMCSTTPSWWQHIYCMDIVSHTSEFHLFDTHRDGLYCSIIIVLISWVLQRYIILSPISWCTIPSVFYLF